MKKIGVMAGTVIDTQMGVDLLKNEGFDAYGYSVSKIATNRINFNFFQRKNLKILFLKNLFIWKKIIWILVLSTATL